MSRFMRKLSGIWRGSVATLSCAAVVVQPALAQMTPLGSAKLVDAPNGVPMVMIERPNAAGVSHNRYSQFDVGPQGVVLNNIDANYGLTGLAGYVPGNPRLDGGTASLIINEVVGADASDLRGYIEVGGARADVIVANPYGITCDGCGFINTDHAVLTTGTPTYAGAALQGFSVDRGLIQIGSKGADARGVSQFDLIARKVSFAGSVHGQRVRVIAGRNDVLFATGAATAKASDGSASPDVAIDSTVFGGMYAQKITIVSTESGVGVRAPERMSAGAGGMRITADGRLVIGSAQSHGGARVAAEAIQVRKQVVVQQELSLEAKREMILDADGVIVAAGAAIIASGADTDLGAGSTLLSAGQMTLIAASALRQGTNARVLSYGDVAVSAGSATLEPGSLTYAGVQQPSGTAEPAKLTYKVTGALQADATKMFATKGMILRADTITLGQTGGLPASQFVSGDQIDIVAGGATLNTAVIEARTTLSITADRALRSAGGGRFASGGPLALSAAEMTLAGTLIKSDATASLTSSGGLTLTGVDLVAKGNVELQAQELNLQGKAITPQSLSVSAAGDVALNATLATGANMGITSGAKLRLDGSANAQGQMTLRGGHIASSADLTSKGALSLTSTQGTLSQSGTVLTEGALTLSSATALTTAGTLTAGGSLSLQAGGALTNRAGLLGGADIALQAAGALTNTGSGLATTGADALRLTMIGSDVTNSGDFEVAGQLALRSMSGALTNTGALTAVGTIHLDASTTLNNQGRLRAGKVLELTSGADMTNAGGLMSNEGLALTSGGALGNTGGIQSGAAIVMAATGALTTSGDGLATAGADAASLSLTGASVSTSGDVAVSGDMILTANAGLVQTEGVLASGGRLSVKGRQITTRGGLQAGGDVTFMSAGHTDLGGTLIGGAGFAAQSTAGDLTLRGRVTMTQTDAIRGSVTLGAAKKLTLTVASSIETASGIVTIDAAEGLDALGTLIVRNAVTLSGAQIQTGGTIRSTGLATLTARTGDLTQGADLQAAHLVAGSAGTLTQSGIVKAGYIKITAGSILNSGAVDSLGPLRLTSATFSNTGTFAAKGNLSLTLTGNLSNQGKIDSDAVLRVSAAGLENASGGHIEGKDMALILSGVAQNAGSILSEGSLNLDAVSLTNTGQMQAAETLALRLQQLRNSGKITSAKYLSAEVRGAFDNSGGQIRAEQLLQLGLTTLDYDPTRWGAVDSPGVVRLQGLNGGRLTALSIGAGEALTATGTLLIRSEAMANAGTVASATSDLILDLHRDMANTGLAYAGRNLIVRSNGSVTNDGGVLLAASNMVLCGNQTENCLANLATDRMTRLTNRNGGRIETLTGDLTIAAGEVRNETAVRVERHTPRETTRRVDVDSASSYCIGDYCAEIDEWYYIEKRKETDRETKLAGARSLIVSGANMVVSAGGFTNSYATASATKDLHFSAGAIVNIGAANGTSIEIKKDHYHYRWRWGRSSTTLRRSDPVQVQFIPTSYAFGTIQAGGTLSGTVTGHLGNNAVGGDMAVASSGTTAPDVTAPATSLGGLSALAIDTSLPGVPATSAALAAGIASLIHIGTANPTAPSTLTLTPRPGAGGFTALPGGSSVGIGQVDLSAVQYDTLFKANPSPQSTYLVETRHKFIDQNAFVSSDYFLGKLNHNPDAHIKRLGDAMAETYLIRNQIQTLTGRRILDPDMDERAQIKAMYDNAVDQSKALGLRPGVALSQEQQAALTKDVIWLEERIVAGQKVLVPQVYLTGSRAVGLSGAQIAGRDVRLSAGSVENSGSITAVDTLRISASGNVTNTGRIQAGGALTITSGETLTNQSGQIAGDTVELAAVQIKSDLRTRRIGSGDNHNVIPQGASSIVAAKDLVLVSAGNIILNGTSVTAGTGATITARGSVLLREVETAHSRKLSGDGWNYTARGRSSVTSDLNIKGNLTIKAGGSLITEGTSLDASGAITLDAKGHISLDAARRVSYSDRYSKTGGWLASRVERNERLDVTHQVTKLKAGSTLTIRAGGDIIDQSSQTKAGAGRSLVKAGGNLALTSMTDIHASTSYKRTAYLGGLLDFSSERKSLSTIGRQAQASFAGDVDIIAGKDLTMQGAQISAKGRIRTDIGGQTRLAAAVDTDFQAIKKHHNNSLLVTDTTEVRNTQTAKFTSLQGTSVEFDPDSKVTIGLVGEQAAVGGHALSLIGVSDVKDPTQKMALTKYFLPEGRAPPARGLIAALKAPSRTAASGADSGKTDAAYDFASSTVKIGLPSAKDGAQFAFYDNLKLRPATTVEEMALIKHQFHDQKTQLGVIGKLIVQYLVNTLTAGIGNVALQAATKSLLNGVVEGAVSGDLDLEKLFKNAAFAAVSAGIGDKFGDAFDWGTKLDLPTDNLLPFGHGNLSVAGVVNQLGQSTMTAGLQSLVYGTDFGASFKISFVNGVINLGLADAQNAIGDLVDKDLFKEGSVPHVLLHAFTGCVGSEILGGKCSAGALAAGVSAVWAGFYKAGPDRTGDVLDKARKQQMLASADLLIGFAAALASGGDHADAAAGVGRSAFRNNYLKHEQIDKMLILLNQCGDRLECKRRLIDEYTNISAKQQHELALCGNDLSCLAPHLQAMVKAQQHPLWATIANTPGGGLIRDLEQQAHRVYLGYKLDNDLPTFLRFFGPPDPNYSGAYSNYVDWAQSNCSGLSGASCMRQFQSVVRKELWMQGFSAGADAALKSVMIGLSGGIAVEVTPAAAAAMRACAANPICWSEVTALGGETLLGVSGATTGQTFFTVAATGSAFAGRVVLQHGEQILGILDDAGRVLKPVSQTVDDAGRFWVQAPDGTIGYLDETSKFLPLPTPNTTRLTVADFPQVRTTVSQKQNRHIAGRPEYRGGGTLSSQADAQRVLDAYHSGDAVILGQTSQGFPVVRFNGVTGTNNNVGAGITNQPTNVFIVKGTASPSIVPANPNWTP